MHLQDAERRIQEASARIAQLEHKAELRALRLDLYKALLQGMAIKGCIDYENPMPDLWRCWKTAKVAVEVTEQV